jgi:hypothetical protein
MNCTIYLEKKSKFFGGTIFKIITLAPDLAARVPDVEHLQEVGCRQQTLDVLLKR